MAIAPTNLMSKLRMMPDQELASFARAHQNDPMIFPLAFQESQDRQHLRMAKQAQAAGMQPPKVVQQDLQQIEQTAAPQMAAAPAMGAAQQLPENQGIGQLPAPNLETIHKAAGGIVAFGDGGEVPRYQDQGLIKYPYGMTNAQQPNDLFSIPGMVTGQPFLTANNPDLAKRIAEIEAMPENRVSRATKEQLINDAKQKAGLAATQTALTTPTTLPPKGSPKLPDATVVPAAKQEAEAAGLAAAKAKADADKAAADKAAADAAARLKPPATPGLPSLAGYEKHLSDAIYKNAPNKEDFMKEAAEIDKPFLEAAQANIDKEAKRLSSDKEQDLYMSMIIGGAKMASGSSPHALQNIAEGIAAGAANYKDALKEFRKATQENSKAELALKQYEATGKKDALKSYYSAQEKRDDRFAAGITQLSVQQMQTQGQMAVAGMPGAQERLFTSLADPTSAAYKGFKNYATEMGPEARGDSAIRTAAINKWSSEPMLRQEFNNDFDSYFRMMAGQKQLSGATQKQLEYLKLYAPKGG